MILVAGILAGIGAGYLYYIKIGCLSGTCPLTSSPWITMFMGGLIGYSLSDSVASWFTKKDKSSVTEE
ncbi:MAG: DUF6132 family protein [Bacteroidales bacterium]|nr:DUF6132 family protein [Bacteroidales bacterium]